MRFLLPWPIGLLLAGLPLIGCSPAAPGPAPKRAAVQAAAETSPAANMKVQPPAKHHPLAKERSLAELMASDSAFTPLEVASETGLSLANRPFREVDESRAAAAGIRKLTGKHLVLFTDVPDDPTVQELPAVFDAAFPQWCQHLGIDADAHADWQMRGFLVQDRERFDASGLWPADLPQFLNGYTRGREFWLYNPSSEYYRRHLMLHEGVHGIMFTLQRSSGPAWYMEGMAELLATHRWTDGKLELPHFPASPAEVPKLGRIEIVQTQFKEGTARHLREVFAMENRTYLENGPYAWSWAAAAFLHGHPAYRDRFRSVMKQRAYGDFNDKLKEAYTSDARLLGEEWQVFVSELAHGYDFERTRLDFSPPKANPGPDAPLKVAVAADRGWQNTGMRIETGKQYKLTARGQYTLANEPKPWTSEPNGVTIRYHRGLPLGILLAVVRPDEPAQEPSPFFTPHVIGLGSTIEPKQTGTLYLRINDFAGELADNVGAAEVVVAVEE